MADIEITAADRIVPIFRIPQPRTEGAPRTPQRPGQDQTRSRAPEARVRAMTNLVELTGLERELA
jgi:hypothetical protein